MSPVRRDGLERREQLLDAALRCFVERGVLRTGIEEIRKAAGASPSSVYHHFDGMTGLIVALLSRTFARLFAHLAARVTPTGRARDAVLALVDGHLEWVMANRDEARFMYQAMAVELAGEGSQALAEEKARLLAPVVAHLARFIVAGKLPRWSPLLFDVVLLGPSHEACRRWLAGADIDPRWMRRTFPELAWRCLAPPRRSGR